ncbi:hypothetical protein EBT11_08195 [bacterium]|nr:hypothetical protein [bacterium]
MHRALSVYSTQATRGFGRLLARDRVEQHDRGGQKKTGHREPDQGHLHLPGGTLVQSRLLDLDRIEARWEATMTGLAYTRGERVKKLLI